LIKERYSNQVAVAVALPYASSGPESRGFHLSLFSVDEVALYNWLY